MTFDQRVLGAGQQFALHRLSRVSAHSPFYLGGGIAVALHLGHRKSLDLDWFTSEPMGDPLQLAASLQDAGLPFEAVALDRGTLHGRLARVPVSFLEYRYPLLQPSLSWDDYGCEVASLDDLACMKLSAVAQRGSKKDFIDVYAIGLRHAALDRMLQLYREKFSIQDIAHVLYGLSYFDDADRERTPRMLWDVDWRFVKATLRDWVRGLAR